MARLPTKGLMPRITLASDVRTCWQLSLARDVIGSESLVSMICAWRSLGRALAKSQILAAAAVRTSCSPSLSRLCLGAEWGSIIIQVIRKIISPAFGNWHSPSHGLDHFVEDHFVSYLAVAHDAYSVHDVDDVVDKVISYPPSFILD